MLTDAEKQKIIESIMQAFDKWREIYYQNLFGKLNTSKGFDAYKIAFDEESFMERRALEPAVYMDVLKKCSKSTTISKHRTRLIKSAIISILKGSFTLTDLDSKSKNSDGLDESKQKEYTRRHKQRIVHQYYPESIFAIKPKQNDVDDERFNHFSSVFSNNRLPESPIDIPARNYRTIQSELALSDQALMDRIFFNSVLRFAFPQFLEDILRFRDECKTVFENMGENNDKIRFLREELMEFNPTLTTFYSHLTSILAVEWFRQKSEKDQILILKSNLQFRYKKSDAEKAKNLILSNTKDRKYTGFLLSNCANAFINYGRYQEAISLFEQCKDLTEKELEKGIILQNIAVAYRSNKNFKLMLQTMKKALLQYKKSNSIYQICMAYQLIGESRWQLGLKESAMKSFQDAEETGKLLNQNETYKIPCNIGTSFNRLGEKSLRNKYWMKALTLIPEEETEIIIKLNDMLDYR